MAKTDLVMKDLAALFQSEASKAEVRAVPSVTAFDMDSIREIVKEEEKSMETVKKIKQIMEYIFLAIGTYFTICVLCAG